MVKGCRMLISEFARRTGLTTDTVRFYVRRGLLTPETNGKGGRNPYQVFTADHVRAAKIIRTAQSLGMSLKDIAAISRARREGRMSRDRSIEVLKAQLRELEAKAKQVDALRLYLCAKLNWLAGGEKGQPPDVEQYLEVANSDSPLAPSPDFNLRAALSSGDD
jgi:MerR family copper efflux transcriptional regulator